MSVDVGGEVDSRCTKCKETTLHIVVAKVDDEIVKVECKRCRGQHRYRPPEGKKKKAAKKTSARAATRSTSKRKSASSRAASRAAAPEPPPTPSVEPDLGLPVRDYDMAETYAVAERIVHPRFGVGVVEATPAANRVQVCFTDARRVLRQGS